MNLYAAHCFVHIRFLVAVATERAGRACLGRPWNDKEYPASTPRDAEVTALMHALSVAEGLINSEDDPIVIHLEGSWIVSKYDQHLKKITLANYFRPYCWPAIVDILRRIEARGLLQKVKVCQADTDAPSFKLAKLRAKAMMGYSNS